MDNRLDFTPKARILVVDDAPENRLLIASLINPSYTVKGAADADHDLAKKTRQLAHHAGKLEVAG